MTYRCTPLTFFLFFLLLIGASSCEKFSGDQTVPAYLSIDSVYLRTDYYSQGTASHSITDAWVYVDDQFLGAFELPARLPVLFRGKHKVMLWPGVKRDGIAATRISYPYYTPITKDITFTEDSTSSVGVIKTTYQTTAAFKWKEDFEGIGISLDTTSRSQVKFELTDPSDPLTFEGAHSAIVQLDSLGNFFECQTHEEFPIPAASVYLEMNFNLSNSLTVGVVVYSLYTLYQSPIITLNPTNGAWKKIYIDLTTTLNSYSGMTSYRVYLGTYKDADKKESVILLDNFKIVTLK